MATLVATTSLDAIKVYEGTCRPPRVIWGFRATKQMSKRGHSIRVLAHLIRQEIVFGVIGRVARFFHTAHSFSSIVCFIFKVRDNQHRSLANLRGGVVCPMLRRAGRLDRAACGGLKAVLSVRNILFPYHSLTHHSDSSLSDASLSGGH